MSRGARVRFRVDIHVDVQDADRRRRTRQATAEEGLQAQQAAESRRQATVQSPAAARPVIVHVHVRRRLQARRRAQRGRRQAEVALAPAHQDPGPAAPAATRRPSRRASFAEAQDEREQQAPRGHATGRAHRQGDGSLAARVTSSPSWDAMPATDARAAITGDVRSDHGRRRRRLPRQHQDGQKHSCA